MMLMSMKSTFWNYVFLSCFFYLCLLSFRFSSALKLLGNIFIIVFRCV
nr:MAG TPA: hypothetical protein [Caudoviricetes sp.]